MYNVKQQLCNRDRQIEDVANHWGKYGNYRPYKQLIFNYFIVETILRAMSEILVAIYILHEQSRV